MRTKNVELDVDFIGEQRPLTKAEEKAISDFIRNKKSKKTKTSSRKKVTIKQIT